MRLDKEKVKDESKKATDEVFLALGGKIFFSSVEPMKSRSKFPRRGYGEFVSELVAFARKAHDLADLWTGEGAVVALATKIRTIYGFGGKGFRMKEIILDLAEVTKAECPDVAQQLVDFGVVGPGPRRTLNFVFNRRWFDNARDQSPAAETMYLEELREFQAYLMAKTEVPELKTLNLLGVQFALCEASKYIFYLRYEAGQLYAPSSRDFELALQEVSEAEKERLRGIWAYWEQDGETGIMDIYTPTIASESSTLPNTPEDTREKRIHYHRIMCRIRQQVGTIGSGGDVAVDLLCAE